MMSNLDGGEQTYAHNPASDYSSIDSKQRIEMMVFTEVAYLQQFANRHPLKIPALYCNQEQAFHPPSLFPFPISKKEESIHFLQQIIPTYPYTPSNTESPPSPSSPSKPSPPPASPQSPFSNPDYPSSNAKAHYQSSASTVRSAGHNVL